MCRGLFACALASLAFAGGCSSNCHCHGGQLVAELGPADKPAVEEAPYEATYALYHWRKPPEGPVPETWVAEEEVKRLYLRGLSRRAKVGFERDDKGHLFAVAGDEKIPLADGRYCWHITKETEYRGIERVLHEAGENVLAVVALPFVVVGAVLVVPAAMGAGFLLWCCS